MSYFILLCACLKWPNEPSVRVIEAPEIIFSQNITKMFYSNRDFADMFSLPCSKDFHKFPPLFNTIMARGKYLLTCNSLDCNFKNGVNNFNCTSEILVLPFVEILHHYITPQKATIDFFQKDSLIFFKTGTQG